MSPALRDKVVKTRPRPKKQLLKAGAGGALQTTPIFDGDYDHSFDSAASDNLRAFADSRIHQFAESCLRVL
jgi:hypothetical protein